MPYEPNNRGLNFKVLLNVLLFVYYTIISQFHNHWNFTDGSNSTTNSSTCLCIAQHRHTYLRHQNLLFIRCLYHIIDFFHYIFLCILYTFFGILLCFIRGHRLMPCLQNQGLPLPPAQGTYNRKNLPLEHILFAAKDKDLQPAPGNPGVSAPYRKQRPRE